MVAESAVGLTTVDATSRRRVMWRKTRGYIVLILQEGDLTQYIVCAKGYMLRTLAEIKENSSSCSRKQQKK